MSWLRRDLADISRLQRALAQPQLRHFIYTYAYMLGVEGEVYTKLRDTPHAAWLGRATCHPRVRDRTLIEVQHRLLADPRTLERVVAHEMVHHWQAAQDPTGTDPDHGPKFLEGAAIINRKKGRGFVTEYVKVPKKSKL